MINCALSLGYYVHFLSATKENEPKERRIGERGSWKRKSEHAAFSLPATSSLPYEPHSPVGFADKAFAYFNLIEFCFQINALAGFNTLSRGSDSGGFF